MSSKSPNTNQARVRVLEQQLESKELRLAEQERVLSGILQSRSWRWTQALRSIASRIRDFAGRLNGRSPERLSGTRAAGSNVDAENVGFKDGFAKASRIVLEEFLASGARLGIPITPEPRVSVILVVCNRAELTLPCLRSLAEQQGIGFELIIVDNGSTDRTTSLFDRVDGARVLRNRENLYFIHAVNQGAAPGPG